MAKLRGWWFGSVCAEGMVFTFLISFTAMARISLAAETFEKVGQVTFDSQMKFDGVRFGGISGLSYDEAENVVWAVSDDKGTHAPPRVYKLKLSVTEAANKKIDVQLQLDARFEIKDSKKSLFVLDSEGLAMLPWGDLLVSGEGDEASRPRRLPRLLSMKIIDENAEEGKPKKPFAKYMRDFSLPEWYRPEKTGKPTKGLRTNLGFEGMAISSDGRLLTLASESNLYQDPLEQSRFLQYEMSTAWTMKASREWSYPLDENLSGLWLLRGISEIIQAETSKYWVLERGLQIANGGQALTSQLYEVDLAGGHAIPSSGKRTALKDLPALKKRLVYDLDQLALSENFEALAWGPRLSDGRRLLIVASDNNFQNSSSTYFVFLAVGVSPTPKQGIGL